MESSPEWAPACFSTASVKKLLSLIGLALYKSLANGIKVWERSQRLVKEEDVALFFEKLTQDLRNTYVYSRIKFEGNELRFSFPAYVKTLADARGHSPRGEYIEQMGRVEYAFDPIKDIVYKRQANYGQALDNHYQPEQVMVRSVDRVKFNYYYWTQKEELYSQDVLEVPPSGVEVELEFSDKMGRRSMRKFIEIPVGG